MDDNLTFNGQDFWYSIKTYHSYSGTFEVNDDKIITVKVSNCYKGKEVKSMEFSSKMLQPMTMEQKMEYILDCLYVFDKRIDEYNKGNIELG